MTLFHTLFIVILVKGIIAQPQPQMASIPGPFDFIRGKYEDFNSKVIDIQIQYCKTYCLSNFSFLGGSSPGTIGNFRCSPCSCDEQCYFYNDCCPDKVLFEKPDTKIEPTTKYGCHGIKFEYGIGDVLVRMIDTCLDEYPDQEIKKKCYNNESLHWKYIRPYFDYVSEITYKNKYCAVCNNIKTVRSYKTSVHCADFEDYGHLKNSTEVYFHVLNHCTLEFIPPTTKKLNLRRCKPVYEPYYTKCNQTGVWRFYNENIVKACELYTNVVLNTYRNVFCRLCNEEVYWMNLMQEPDKNIIGFTRFSLTSLLNLDDNDQDDIGFQNLQRTVTVLKSPQSNCSDGEILNPLSCQCVEIFCPEGEILVNGQCESVLVESNSFGYTICTHVTGTFNSTVPSPFVAFALSVPEYEYPYYVISINAKPYGVLDCGEGLLNITADVMIKLLFETPVKTDIKQLDLIDKARQLGPSLSKYGGVMVSAIEKDCLSPRTVGFPPLPFDSPCSPVPAQSFLHSMPLRQDIHSVLNSMPFVQLTKLLTCPQLLVNSSQVLVDLDRLILLHNNITLSSGEFDTRDDQYIVCTEDFLFGTSDNACLISVEGGSKNNQTTGEGVKSTTLGILSIICTCISLLFLIITFIFYCTVKYMRNVVGVNVMGLIINLFIAQVVYEFGLELFDYPDLCTAMAIMIHYFWLSATFWMNSCTFVLFMKLSFPLHSRAFTTKYILLRTCMYSTLSPLLIVITTIVINITNSNDIGYGNSAICYINNVNVRRYAFALPLGILILTNIVLFCYTFIRLRIDQIESAINKENKVNIWACLKLSVITGAAWIFAFVYEASGAIVFAYFFTILVGLQGVVLFFAFVVNKRVLKACRESVHGSSYENSAASKQKKYLVKSTTDSPLTSLSKSKSSTDSDKEREVKLRPPIPHFSEDAM